MPHLDAQRLGLNLLFARTALGLSQTKVARDAAMERLNLVRAEAGRYRLRLDESVRLAAVLKISLSELVYGRARPGKNLSGIAVELFHLGLGDLFVSNAEAPGAFRRPEEIVVLAVAGDRPEPRVVEAMPMVLATQSLRLSLVNGFVRLHDQRCGPRLSWLAEVTTALSRRPTFPMEIRNAGSLERLAAAWGRAAQPDSLGHPATRVASPIWRRRNITYAATLDNFLARTIEAAGVAFDLEGD
jgi:transcriptional regulator with XRE-family HTH domain